MRDLFTAVNRDDSKGSTSADANDFSMTRVITLKKMLDKKGLAVDGSCEAMIARLNKTTNACERYRQWHTMRNLLNVAVVQP